MCRTSNALGKHRLEHSKKNLESMYNGEVQSAMMNSYARTTTLNWILDTGAKTLGELQNSASWGIYSYNGEYTSQYKLNFKGNFYSNHIGDDMEYGKYDNYVDLTNTLTMPPFVINIMIDTGADTIPEKVTAANNIYDLAGNAAEWSTEKLINGSGYRASGGSFLNSIQTHSAIDNNMTFVTYGTTGSIDISSRPILYK